MGSSGPGSPLGAGPSDHSYPYYLINGKIPAAPVTVTAKPGQRARLRIINSAAGTGFQVALGGHRMTVTHSDGPSTLSPSTRSCLAWPNATT